MTEQNRNSILRLNETTGQDIVKIVEGLGPIKYLSGVDFK